MSLLSPAYDNKIVRKYSARTLEHKVENKIALQEEIGWIAEPKQAILCLPTEMTDALGGALAQQLFAGLLELPIGILVRGKGSNKYGDMLMKLSKQHAYKLKIMPDGEAQMRKMLSGADMALFLADITDDTDLRNCMHYGVIPVAPAHELLENYNPVQETGNAFLYEKSTVWQSFAAIVRAVETFKFPFDWRTIQRHAMETVQGDAQNEEVA